MISHDNLYLITSLEGKLKAAVSLREQTAEHWLLLIKLMYDGEAAGELSFNLHGYGEREAHEVAKNLGTNAFIMREIDEYLWGESD